MRSPSVFSVHHLVMACILFSSSSCLLLLEPTPAENIIQDLHLCSDYRWGLFGNTVVEGSVKNNYWKQVSGVEIRATVFDYNNQQIEERDFTLSTDITTDGTATFKEIL